METTGVRERKIGTLRETQPDREQAGELSVFSRELGELREVKRQSGHFAIPSVTRSWGDEIAGCRTET